MRGWKLVSVALAGLLVVGLTACEEEVPTEAQQQGVMAKVPGTDVTATKLVFKFNVIGHPGDYNGNCGEGHRIFVDRGANHAHIDIEYSDHWAVTDCNAKGGNWGELLADGTEGQTQASWAYDVYVRLLGKPGGHLGICSTTDDDHLANPGHADDECLIGSFNIDGSKDRIAGQPLSWKVNDLFGDPLEDVVWSTYTNEDFRIAEFRVYLR